MIIAAFNPKGGVGKTTTAVNMAAAMAMMGKPVLLVDLEADVNASISLGVRPSDVSPSISDLLLHRARASDAIRRVSGVERLSLICGSPAMADMDHALRHVRQPERRLADVIRPLTRQFEVIVLDAPAGFNLVTRSVPQAADHLVVPVRAEYLSLESLAQLLRWFRDRRGARLGPAPIAGILLTMVDGRRQATREIVDIIRVHNRHSVFETEIPTDPRAAEAPSHGLPLVRYAASRASVAYRRLARELLERVQPHPRARR